MKVKIPSEVRSSFPGFQSVVKLKTHIQNQQANDVYEIDMSKLSWFDANMCAAFGSILYSLNFSGKKLNIIKPQNNEVKKIFNKNKFNSFLSEFGYHENNVKDVFGTTIPYQRFEREEIEKFRKYIQSHFVGKGIPDMSPPLLSKFRQSIAEIFDNCVVHSDTKMGIFVCGQYFPKKACLDFSIADLGVGIRQNIQEKLHLNLSAEDAIKWALEGANTTKHGKRPGGHGLKLLQEFISYNEGRMVIVSDVAYWEMNKLGTKVHTLQEPFPGTVVTIEINTSDTKSYRLASELEEISDPNDFL